MAGKYKDYDYSEDEEIEDNRNSVNKILKKHFKEKKDGREEENFRRGDGRRPKERARDYREI